MKKLILFLSVCLFVSSPLFAQTKVPTAVLFQVKGNVEYTRNGRSWRKVRRNKFLFDGYQVRTGADGYGKVTVKQTGENFELTPNSTFEVAGEEIIAKSGSITPVESSGKLVSGLIKKFDKSQSYTTVRRSAQRPGVAINATRKNLKISKKYPYLVWENPDDTLEYKVTVGDKTYHVPPTDALYIRLKLDKFNGAQDFNIIAMEDGEEVAELGKHRKTFEEGDYSVTWISDDEEKMINEEIKNIQEVYGTDSFVMGRYFDEHGMLVAAMDTYKKYLEENPDEIEMAPYLFRVYKDLALKKIYNEEREEWQKAMME